MTIMNSADLRNNLSEILEIVAQKRQTILVGRFGQPKAVIMDVLTYNWQKQVLQLLKKIKKLNSSEVETLNILLDDKTRESLLSGLREAEKGEVISLDEFKRS